jgi:hypothetical protein
MKRYYQEGYRDSDGDVLIEQYSEVTLPSGIIIPNQVSRIEIVSGVSLPYLIEQMGVEFHYEPDFSRFGFEISPELVTQTCFSLMPSEPTSFRKQSVSAIVRAFHALTYRDIPPKISIAAVQELDWMADDDKETLRNVAQAVHATVNGIDTPELETVPIGQYL